MRLQFADRSITKPEGKIEHVLVKVDKFLFSADFLILDYKADRKVPIILGRSFLSTGHPFIDHQGELTMHLNYEKIKLNVVNAMKFPVNDESCSAIESLGWDYYEEEASFELFMDPENENEEINVVSDARKFESLDLQTKGKKKTMPSVRTTRTRTQVATQPLEICIFGGE
ncbi:uncharacterized protein E5676_scaffold264G001220 [Cucumis melo var. makuwa]|uniref:Reverse transcriptase domain-containing protein n=1 Tax=Cucumis melo var. makuwa TaxID=1194695 RepID=A0A5D3BPL1_CUCMM|nr:uncharacterized protein E5676_scaffold264G001220 [Cucumis melo var. makuwa]